MALGPTVRRFLGPRLGRTAGRCYRAVFVDLDEVAQAVTTWLPPAARLLDIGGGDGEALNRLLTRRPDVHVTTLDTSALLAQYLEPRFEAQVTRLPCTTLAQYLDQATEEPQVVLLADVLHHVPPAARPDLLAGLARLLERVASLRIIVKDIEPGSWRAWLACWTDRYITGDRHVDPISRAELIRLFTTHLGELRWQESDLIRRDHPNYAVAFFR